MYNFYSIYTIDKCGRWPHNTIWRAAGWSPMVYTVVYWLLLSELSHLGNSDNNYGKV